MSIPPAYPNVPPSQVVLPDDLIIDILSLLPVKPLMRFMCISNSWNTLISDPTFVKMHLQRSARNAHLTLMRKPSISRNVMNSSVVPFPVRRLLENPLTIPDDPCYQLNRRTWVVGSCNGLLCLHGLSLVTSRQRENWICFWNPAIRMRSEKLGSFCEEFESYLEVRGPLTSTFKYAFGYDNSTDTYKVVAFRVIRNQDEEEASRRSEVRVFSLGDNIWRTIQSFPVVPLHYTFSGSNDGVYLSGTLNWLGVRNNFNPTYDYDRKKKITAEQFVIVSLDLSMETYTELLLPQGFDEVPRIMPTVGVLMDCLCFSHDFKGTDFVIWQMKEFGAQESWTLFLKINYQNLLNQMDLQMDDDIVDSEYEYEYEYGYGYGHEYEFQLMPLCLSENGDTLILANENREDHAILYNWRDNRVELTKITDDILWFYAKDYVESLVSPR